MVDDDEDNNRDLQLIRARQQFGNGRVILKEGQRFEYSKSLFVLCTSGGRLVDAIHFSCCAIDGMPLQPKECNFFWRLEMAARFGPATQKMIPKIIFEFSQPIESPHLPKFSSKWKIRKGMEVLTEYIENCQNERIIYKLTYSCAQRGKTFNKFELCRVSGLANLVMRIFTCTSKDRNDAVLDSGPERIPLNDAIPSSVEDCGPIPAVASSSKSNQDEEEEVRHTLEEAIRTKPVPAERRMAARWDNCENCIADQYECQVHQRRLKTPMKKPEGFDALLMDFPKGYADEGKEEEDEGE